MGTAHGRGKWASQGRRRLTNSADLDQYRDAIAHQYVGPAHQDYDPADEHSDGNADQYVGAADEHPDGVADQYPRPTDEHPDVIADVYFDAAPADRCPIVRPMPFLPRRTLSRTAGGDTSDDQPRQRRQRCRRYRLGVPVR